MPWWDILIIVFAVLPVIIFMIVAVISRMIGVHNYLTDNINGHSIEVKTGDGYAFLSIDGKTVDKIIWFLGFTATMHGVVDNIDDVTTIRNVGWRYRITTLVNGNKNETLSKN
ncbi:MAG: hypothetical protein K2H78_03640 [Clostridia bacterium]|nr:hypothetical protein [Clostridia bacterium]